VRRVGCRTALMTTARSRPALRLAVASGGDLAAAIDAFLSQPDLAATTRAKYRQTLAVVEDELGDAPVTGAGLAGDVEPPHRDRQILHALLHAHPDPRDRRRRRAAALRASGAGRRGRVDRRARPRAPALTSRRSPGLAGRWAAYRRIPFRCCSPAGHIRCQNVPRRSCSADARHTPQPGPLHRMATTRTLPHR
jgi:hypothetical protein